MTTKQGLFFRNNQNISKPPIIEGNTVKAKPVEYIDTVAPLHYTKIVEENSKHADEAFVKCKHYCDTQYSEQERQACYLGCEIKEKAGSPGEMSLKESKNFSIPYDKWKKEYTRTFPKTSNKRIKRKRTVWRPKDKYKRECITAKTCSYHYKLNCRERCWNSWWGRRYCRYFCWWDRYLRCRTRTIRCYNVLVKKGKIVTIPAKWKYCQWEETFKYPQQLIGKKLESQPVNDCSMFKEDNKEDIDSEHYKDYSPYKLSDACYAGMENYVRKDCSLVNNKIDCTGTKNGRYLMEDMQKKEKEEETRRSYLVKSTSSTDNTNEPVEPFSNLCKDKCKKYEDAYSPVQGTLSNIQKNMNDSTDECYKCELKHNPLIRYESAKQEYIDNIIYRTSKKVPVSTMIDNINKEYKPRRNELMKYNGKYNSRNENTIQNNILEKNKTLYDLINNMSYSKKNNATIRAFLEDMENKTPNKNIEYGIWAGLTVLAGVTVAALATKD